MVAFHILEGHLVEEHRRLEGHLKEEHHSLGVEVRRNLEVELRSLEGHLMVGHHNLEERQILVLVEEHHILVGELHKQVVVQLEPIDIDKDYPSLEKQGLCC